ncbi:MAG TPA: hypothetical protein P5279_05600 [Anaerohalosphaeraceae bacterium]|jgi:hypothetical protein|nr:hypothetical protein [Anaerohalosphaeraceae bacterium]HRT49946.1 hypothetical protein [Anaerohalosphaeraceae bacterium]HRT85756.1 hypothetical protein [Anaerohalosphaeraceae bacterium]
MALPNTETRVIENTCEEINRCLRREIEARVLYFARNPELIDGRLEELDSEWDIERVLEAHAAGVSLLGVLLASRNRKWLILPLAVAGFLMQHALQGWCPPVPLFRKLGIRTTMEINTERYALKALRGDFDALHPGQSPEEKAEAALKAARQRL